MSHPGSNGLLRVLLVATLMLVAANLRPALTVVGPLIEQIGAETDMTPALLGMLGALPVFTFGVVSPFVHVLSRRVGMERSVLIALIVLTGGTLLRSLPGDEIALLLGTVVLSGAIAIGNVLVPAVVKNDFPEHVPLMTGLYTAILVGAAAVGSGLAIPLSRGLGLGWEITLALIAGFSLVAVFLWGLRLRLPTRTGGHTIRSTRRRAADTTTHGSRSGAEAAHLTDSLEDTRRVVKPLTGPGPTVWGSAIAWQVTLFFGLQSGIFYTMLTWLASIQTFYGVTEETAGWWLAAYQAIGIISSILVGRVMQGVQDQRYISAGISALMAMGITGMILAPTWMPMWILISGFASGGALMVGLSLISLRTYTSEQTRRLSGMAQGVGYLMAGLGPILAGILFDLSGSWVPVLCVALVVAILQAITGFLAGRNIHVHSRILNTPMDHSEANI